MHPNLHATSTYFNSVDGCGGGVTSEALSHAYGELVLSSPCGLYNDTSDIVKSKHGYKLLQTDPSFARICISFQRVQP